MLMTNIDLDTDRMKTMGIKSNIYRQRNLPTIQNFITNSQPPLASQFTCLPSSASSGSQVTGVCGRSQENPHSLDPSMSPGSGGINQWRDTDDPLNFNSWTILG